MKKVLSQISKSPFTRGIEKVKLPRRFHQPTFTMYNGRTDPVEYVSQFKQKMAVHSQDEALLCRVFPSSLGPMPMRWFDGFRTFKVSLPSEHGLRKSLTGKPVTSLRQLMDRVDKYKRIEDDQQQGKGKAKVVPQERRDFRSNRYNNNRPRRDYAEQTGSNNNQVVEAVFREPMHRVLEKIKNESFIWPNKMMGNLEK